MTTTPSPDSRTPSPALPPSARDFLAYERLVIDTLSTRQVAEELKISQTRVRQIVRRVADWLEENLPETSESRQATELRLAQHIASDRLARYLEEANYAWRQTHESKYMTTILRLITALSKLPAHPGAIEALFADAIEGPLPRGAVFQPAIAPPHPSPPPPLAPSPSPSPPSSFSLHPSSFPPPPPPGDCSPNPTSPPRPTPNTTPPTTPTPNLPTTSNNHPSPTKSARQAFLAPAHLAIDDPDSSAVTELKITPHSLGLTPTKHSTRRERRRLQRLTAKK